MIRAVAAGCIAAVAAVGQARIEIRLPADPEHRGPPALVFVRGVLAEFDPTVTDPFAALAIEVHDAGVRVRQDTSAAPIADALSATIEIDGGAIHATCDARGLETWRAPGGRALRAAPMQRLATQLDLARAPGPVWLNVATLIGGHAAGVQMESPLGRLLTVGAVECGDLVVALHAEGDDLVVRGRSRGGLTLPALLLHLAARSAPAPNAIETWRVLAHAARDGRREEAALQLAFAADQRVADTLCSLLFATDAAQGRAAESLARRADPGALLPLARALRTTTATQRPALQAALATLWPLASVEARHRALGDAPPGASAAFVEPTPRRAALGLLIARGFAAFLLVLAGAMLVSALRDRSPNRS